MPAWRRDGPAWALPAGYCDGGDLPAAAVCGLFRMAGHHTSSFTVGRLHGRASRLVFTHDRNHFQKQSTIFSFRAQERHQQPDTSQWAPSGALAFALTTGSSRTEPGAST